MDFYHNSGGFHGSTLISTPNGNIAIHNLKKNDLIYNSNNQTSVIECILKIRCFNNTNKICSIANKLKVSPYFPIKINNHWVFAKSIIEPKIINCDYMYNIILRDRSCIKINNYKCPTLAHNITDNIISHDFFGTEKIILNLKSKFTNEYDIGLIQSITSINRSLNTGLVCQYI